MLGGSPSKVNADLIGLSERFQAEQEKSSEAACIFAVGLEVFAARWSGS
jgi:hypothetical protein